MTVHYVWYAADLASARHSLWTACGRGVEPGIIRCDDPANVTCRSCLATHEVRRARREREALRRYRRELALSRR